jgi:hypothetical protein
MSGEIKLKIKDQKSKIQIKSQNGGVRIGGQIDEN